MGVAKSVRVNSGRGGRPKGNGVKHSKEHEKEIIVDSKTTVVDEVTDDIREAIRDVLQANTQNLKGWLTEIGNDDPLKALTLFKDLAEFIVPKLQRSDAKQENYIPVELKYERHAEYKERMEEKKKQSIATPDDYK